MGRKRTISGTHSDRSSNSYRELTFIKSIHEHQANGSDTRLMFTAKHGRIPFTITSVISWQKAQTRSTNRFVINNKTPFSFFNDSILYHIYFCEGFIFYIGNEIQLLIVCMTALIFYFTICRRQSLSRISLRYCVACLYSGWRLFPNSLFNPMLLFSGVKEI